MPEERSIVLQKAKSIRMLIMDVDGVLTDGRIIYAADGQELKNFNVRDGFGIRLAQRVGIKTAVITARYSKVVTQRTRELEIAEVHQNALKKLPAYEQILENHQLADEQVAYIGDDLVDLPLLRRAGLAIAVADATSEVKQAVHYVTQTAGGKGAVREAVELILKAQGIWQEATARYF